MERLSEREQDEIARLASTTDLPRDRMIFGQGCKGLYAMFSEESLNITRNRSW